MGEVDAALRATGISPGKPPTSLPWGASLRTVQRGPLPGPLPVPPSPFEANDENAYSLPASPDKAPPAPGAGFAARWGRALSGSLENMRGLRG
jgi:hypothetical protein